MVRQFARVFMVLAAIAVTGAATAGDNRASNSVWAGVREAPIKDCTRINGRYGYYGNIWCTPAEQARFDRWSAQKRWVR